MQQKRRINKNTLMLGILVILLCFSNVYFFRQAQTLDYSIVIGTPTQKGQDGSIGMDFTQSQPLKEQTQMDIVLFSLIRANSIEKEDSTDALPYAILAISSPQKNITHMYVAVWLTDDAVLLATREDGEYQNYKRLDNPYYMEELKKLIESQIELL